MSNSDVVIRVEGLGKKYTLQHRQRHNTLRDLLAAQAREVSRWANPFTLAGQLRRTRLEAALEQKRGQEDFWALKDVNFEIRRGERVGIIGRNGAGKSTLLKILSRITEPTTGRVAIRGRVASLLEVGTGFHPELTGLENIYLNGTILGMTRREIKAKFDEIVAFAEVEKFLDTPIKRYSSGMNVRLAFAVAAHLEPEILVVDEVLAVGDARFQMKCLGKMEEVSEKSGRTVIFVSHQMDAIQQLCSTCFLIDSGTMSPEALRPAQAIERYLNGGRETGAKTPHWERMNSSFDNAHITPLMFGLKNIDGEYVNKIVDGSEHFVEIRARLGSPDPGLSIGYDLLDSGGRLIYRSYFTDSENHPSIHFLDGAAQIVLKSSLPNYINNGKYVLKLTGGIHYRTWLFRPESHGPEFVLDVDRPTVASQMRRSRSSELVAPVLDWSIAHE